MEKNRVAREKWAAEKAKRPARPVKLPKTSCERVKACRAEKRRKNPPNKVGRPKKKVQEANELLSSKAPSFFQNADQEHSKDVKGCGRTSAAPSDGSIDISVLSDSEMTPQILCKDVQVISLRKNKMATCSSKI